MKKDEVVDYLPNSAGVRLCSERMRELINSNLGPDDRVQWLPAEVFDIFGESHPYFVLHLPDSADIINRTKSIMAGDFVVKAVIDIAKVGSRHILRLPEAILTLIVSSELAQVLTDARCTGLRFERVPAI